jgi:hypothetical protein
MSSSHLELTDKLVLDEVTRYDDTAEGLREALFDFQCVLDLLATPEEVAHARHQDNRSLVRLERVLDTKRTVLFDLGHTVLSDTQLILQENDSKTDHQPACCSQPTQD